MKTTKNYTVRVHYDICFEETVQALDANAAVQKAINKAADRSLDSGEVTNVEAYIENWETEKQ